MLNSSLSRPGQQTVISTSTHPVALNVITVLPATIETAERLRHIVGPIYKALFGVMVGTIVLSTLFFLMRRQQDYFLRRRPLFPLLLGAFGALFVTAGFMGQKALDQGLPCVLMSWILYIGCCMSLFSFTARFMWLQYNHRLNRAKVKMICAQVYRPRETMSQDREDETTRRTRIRSSIQIRKIYSKQSGPTATDAHPVLTNGSRFFGPDASSQRRLRWLAIGVHLLVLCWLAVLQLYWSRSGRTHDRGNSCSYDWEEIPLMATMAFFALILTPAVFVVLRHVHDPFYVKRELWCTSIVYSLCFVAYFVWSSIADTSILRIVINPGDFVALALFIGHLFAVLGPTVASWMGAAGRERAGEAPLPMCESRRGRAARLRRAIPTDGITALRCPEDYNDRSSFRKLLAEQEAFDALIRYCAQAHSAELPLFYRQWRGLMGRVLVGSGVVDEDALLAAHTRIRGAPQVHAGGYGPRDASLAHTHGPKATVPRGLAEAFRENAKPNVLVHEAPHVDPGLAPDTIVPPFLVEHYYSFFDTFLARGSPLAVDVPFDIYETIVRQFENFERGTRINKGALRATVFDEARTYVVDRIFQEDFLGFVRRERRLVKKVIRR